MVGGPFSADTPEGCEKNIVATEMLGIKVAELGAAPIVPNSIGRSVMQVMASTYAGSATWKDWIEVTLSILSRSDALIVTPDWETSQGVRREVEAALSTGIPVFYDLDTLKEWLHG